MFLFYIAFIVAFCFALRKLSEFFPQTPEENVSENANSMAVLNTSAPIAPAVPVMPTPSQSSVNIETKTSNKKYCHYCCSYSNSEENFCSQCGLPLPDKIYKNPFAPYSAGRLDISMDAILENLESGATEPTPIPIQSALGNEFFIKPILTNEKFVRFYPDHKKIIKQCCSLENFTVIDFETANMYPDSVCQIGIVIVENNEITDAKSFLIRPPYNDFRNSDLHKITLDDVKNSKTFAELWDDIKPFLENKLVAAYNANFDVGCLFATLENFKITPPNFAYFDILQNARNILADENLRSFKLSNVARKLNISIKHHEALSDSIAAAKIQLKFAMSESFCCMFSPDNHFENMIHLLAPNEILRYVKNLLAEKSPEDIDDYQSLISLLDVAQNKGADTAKVLKLKGAVFESFGLKSLALDSYKSAFSINSKIGVKGKIQALEKEF